MLQADKFYIDGSWVNPAQGDLRDVINPATELVVGQVALGNEADVDRAVAAAQRAFASFGSTKPSDRLAILRRILEEYDKRVPDLVEAVKAEIGVPDAFARQAQVPMGAVHLRAAIDALETYQFVIPQGSTSIVKEPVGVCALITPWNWPLNQIACKVAPAIAAGCTIILKPSELAPFSATIFAEIMAEAGVPAGIFNLLHGPGIPVGAALAAHPGVDMVSFTGSTRGGIAVAEAAAPTVKRVHQELGGKSANILLPSADLGRAVANGVAAVMLNSGQSCNAPTRMLVPQGQLEEATALAVANVEKYTLGPPDSGARLGPVASKAQWDRIQAYITRAIDDGASLAAGGPGRPEGLAVGYYVKPTIFSAVTNDFEIAREEIFGPVLVLIGYSDVDEAVRVANDSPYGLVAHVHGDAAEVESVATQLRVGQVILNAAKPDFTAPFGGFKQSGNGREWGKYAFDDFLELKAVIGVAAA